MIKHEKAKGLTHSSFHSLACCPQAVTPWHPGQRERGGQTAASCNESLAARPSSRGSPGPSFRQGDNVRLPALASCTEKAILGRGGSPIAKAAATKKRRAAPSKTEEQGFLLSSWMGKHACKCSAQTPLKNLKLVICLNCRKFGRKAQAQHLIRRRLFISSCPVHAIFILGTDFHS